MADGLRPWGLVFDLDGVLIQSEELHVAAWHEYFRGHGLAKPNRFYEGFIGEADRTLVDHLIRTGELAGPAEVHLAGKRAVYLRLLRHRGRLYPGVLELLNAVAAWSPPPAVAMATSASRAEVAVAGGLGLAGRFPVTVTAEDVRRPKPDPEIYRRAAALLGLPPERCVAVEDSVPGVAAARAAACRVVAVAQTRPARDLAAADAVLPSVAALARRPALLGAILPA